MRPLKLIKIFERNFFNFFKKKTQTQTIKKESIKEDDNLPVYKDKYRGKFKRDLNKSEEYYLELRKNRLKQE